MARFLFEASEAIGVRREELVAPLGLDAEHLTKQRLVEWETMVSMLDRLSLLLDGDVERMRGVGRAMVNVPSWTFLQRLARAMVPVHFLYEAGDRWLAPSAMPEISVEVTLPSEDERHMRVSIPTREAPSEAYFYIFEGLLSELPTLLGLPIAKIVKSHVTGHTMEITLRLPRSSSLFGRIKRGVRAALYNDAFDALEGQRRELAEGFAIFKRESVEIHALLDELPDLVMIHREGILLWVNSAAVKTLGYDRRDDLVGKPLLAFVPRHYHELVTSRLKAPSDHSGLTDGALLTRAGRTVLCEISRVRGVTFDGLPARLLVGRDVTERTRLRQRLIAADRMASLGMLAAGVAHEVNNPLAYVLNNIELASKDLVPLGEATESSRAALAVALEGVDRIRNIVHQLLLLARSDDHTVAPIDVRAVVESTIALAATEIRRRAKLVCEYEAVPLARATEARLGQVLLNLLVNALEAMAERPQETNELRVTVCSGAGRRVLVEVSDNGPGVPTELSARVFDPFFTTKPQGQGTGLGLSISQRLLSEIGGELTYESVPHQKTTFRIALPAAAEVVRDS
jgi:PAS domain S-box-containing protein